MDSLNRGGEFAGGSATVDDYKVSKVDQMRINLLNKQGQLMNTREGGFATSF